MAGQYLLGLDLGSAFIKAALVDAATRQAVAAARSPEVELPIAAPQPGWAEQDPRTWWEHAVRAVREVLAQGGVDAARVAGLGIAYQMHGLVLLDQALEPLRPAIIWCDSRAAALGEEACAALGREWCLPHLLNVPGNFTAAKLGWVKRHEPELFARARWAMLPGDYIACRLTGQAATTACGLSEMILWDFAGGRLATEVLDHYGIDHGLIPPLAPTFGEQGRLTPQAAAELGLAPGTPLTYRAGDQPNNALSLGALQPGEVAATAGTSGVIYAVTDRRVADTQSRVNTFLHVNHTPDAPRYGVLLCVNGAGSSYRWLRQSLSLTSAPSYQVLSALAEQAPPGAEGLTFLPFGNGAERMLGNRCPGAGFYGLDFNRHSLAHVARAVQEGVAFAMAYGLHALRGLGLEVEAIRAAAANMFLSDVFARALANAGGVAIELRRTDGATGAALGAGYGIGRYPALHDALSYGARLFVETSARELEAYTAAYGRWQAELERALG
jgi:xylulokinase